MITLVDLVVEVDLKEVLAVVELEIQEDLDLVLVMVLLVLLILVELVETQVDMELAVVDQDLETTVVGLTVDKMPLLTVEVEKLVQ